MGCSPKIQKSDFFGEWHFEKGFNFYYTIAEENVTVTERSFLWGLRKDVVEIEKWELVSNKDTETKKEFPNGFKIYPMLEDGEEEPLTLFINKDKTKLMDEEGDILIKQH